MSAHSLSYKAGRCHRRPDSNFVDAVPEKGTLSFGLEDGRELAPSTSKRQFPVRVPPGLSVANQAA